MNPLEGCVVPGFEGLSKTDILRFEKNLKVGILVGNVIEIISEADIQVEVLIVIAIALEMLMER